MIIEKDEELNKYILKNEENENGVNKDNNKIFKLFIQVYEELKIRLSKKWNMKILIINIFIQINVKNIFIMK